MLRDIREEFKNVFYYCVLFVLVEFYSSIINIPHRLKLANCLVLLVEGEVLHCLY